MNPKISKIILVFVFLAAFGSLFYINIPIVKAATVEELQAMIAQLQAQIAALQQQLAQLQGEEGEEWCHDFNVNLRYGDSGSEVAALQTALEKEGFSIGGTEETQQYFGDYTASAVVGFQEKYAADILAPWGLVHGTGYVGTTTRAKLNALYGCVEEPYIRAVSPNGEEEWVAGGTYDITWASSGINKVYIEYEETRGDAIYDEWIALGISASLGKYSWTIPQNIPLSDKYKIFIQACDPFGTSCEYPTPRPNDRSDNYFSIVEQTCGGFEWSGYCWYEGAEGQNCTTVCASHGGNVGTCQENDNSSCELCHLFHSGASCIGVNETYDPVYFPYFNRCDYRALPTSGSCTSSNPGGRRFCTCKEASITVLSPNGGEQWQIGTPYTISWQLANAPAGATVGLALYKGGIYKPEYFRAYQQPSTAVSYSWTVPNTIPAGNDYKMEVEMYNSSGSLVVLDQSDAPFSIVSSVAGSLNISTDASSPSSSNIAKGANAVNFLVAQFSASNVEDIRVNTIRVSFVDTSINPISSQGITNVRLSAVGGIFIGSTQQLNSQGSALFDNLDLALAKATSQILTVKADVPVTSNASTVKAVIAGNGVSATGITSGASIQCPGQAVGNIMTIVEPTITVKFPNGGEKWVVGNTYKIQWTSTGIEKVSLLLTKKEGEVFRTIKVIASNVSAASSSYSWKISADVVPDNYFISVNSGGMLPFDVSDSYFSIFANAYDIVPDMVYPVDGQTLDLEGSYMFKVKPITGSVPDFYLFGLFQDDVMIYENWRDDRQLSIGGEFAVHPDNPYHSKFHAGDLKVMIRALINGQWTDARTLNLKLVPRTS